MSGTHIPVLLSEVIERLKPADGETYIDATFGAGGYTRAILEVADCKVRALDRDPSAVANGHFLVEEFKGRLSLSLMPFADLLVQAETSSDRVSKYDGAVFDLGVSSMQLEDADRGFSFQGDGPLDMRMFAAPGQTQNEQGPSAADVVNTFDEAKLADIIFQFGEERRSRVIAKAIVARREEIPFVRTSDLADVVAKVFGRSKADGKHVATRTFQALRIFVNDEISQLVRGLAGAERSLKPGGRLVVVTFHSLEDRIVKRFLASRSGKGRQTSRHMPVESIELSAPSFQIVNQPALTSRKGELELNPRARSARLRSAVRTDGDAWPLEFDDLGVPALART